MNPSRIPKTKIPIWLTVLGLICFLGAIVSFLIHFFSEDPSKVVEGQILSLRNKKISEAYYTYTSEEFQAQTSFENFQEFLKENPIFFDNTSVQVSDKVIELDRSSFLILFYIGSEEKNEAIYNLIKEKNGWKILGIEVIEHEESPSVDSSMTSELITPIEMQLSAFQKHDLLGAYTDLVSKQFQTNTPFDKFKTYVLQNAILTDFKNYDFKEHFIEGSQGIVTVVLNPDAESILVKYKLIRENDEWKIELMKVVPPVLQASEVQPNSAQMISFIEEMFAQLKEKNYDQVYQNFIAENIKKDTPLETFKKFLRKYPALSNYQSMNIKEPLIDGNVGHLVVDLHNAEGVTSVEYTLKLVDNQWKIEGMHVVNVPVVPETSSSNGKNYKTRELLSIIQAFLKAVHSKEEEKAYRAYTSQNFKFTNSFADFQKYLKAHSELTTSTSSSFEKLMFNNNVATFGGKLYLSDKLYLPIEFDLVQEDDKWKILNIFTYPTAEIVPETKSNEEGVASIPLEFTKITLGTTVDDEGHIENPTTIFHQNSGDINMNLFISNGVAGTKLEIILRHVDSNSEIPAVSSTLTSNGETELSFAFSPPPKGWPKGSYQIRITSSTKVFKTFPFTVD